MGTPAKPGKFQLQRRIMAMRSNHICLLVLLPGAPSAGAFRKQCSALFLATGPREANASCIAAQHEAVPTVKSRNIAYNYTHLSPFIVGVGLCSTRRAFPPHTTQKKTRKRNRSQVFHLGAPSAGAFRKQCGALFLATELPRANQHHTVVLVAACGRPPCSRPWCKPKKSPRS